MPHLQCSRFISEYDHDCRKPVSFYTLNSNLEGMVTSVPTTQTTHVIPTRYSHARLLVQLV